MKAEGTETIGGLIAGALAGAKFGSGIGIVGRPALAMAGTIPCAIIGGVIGGLTSNKVGDVIDRSGEKPEQ